MKSDEDRLLTTGHACHRPDVLLWLGIKKIDHLISMSDMKYNAIVGSGIEVKERHEMLVGSQCVRMRSEN